MNGVKPCQGFWLAECANGKTPFVFPIWRGVRFWWYFKAEFKFAECWWNLASVSLTISWFIDWLILHFKFSKQFRVWSSSNYCVLFHDCFYTLLHRIHDLFYRKIVVAFRNLVRNNRAWNCGCGWKHFYRTNWISSTYQALPQGSHS